jgi:hypothetical protein
VIALDGGVPCLNQWAPPGATEQVGLSLLK